MSNQLVNEMSVKKLKALALGWFGFADKAAGAPGIQELYGVYACDVTDFL
jgi:hypothetical protein